MTEAQSSVNPPSSKLPWGTILKPTFGLGYQKRTEDEIASTVERLNSQPQPKEPVYPRNNKQMTQEEIDEMLQRLSKPSKDIPDSDRRVEKSIYKEMGVVSSYAWNGFN